MKKSKQKYKAYIRENIYINLYEDNICYEYYLIEDSIFHKGCSEFGSRNRWSLAYHKEETPNKLKPVSIYVYYKLKALHGK